MIKSAKETLELCFHREAFLCEMRKKVEGDR